MKLPHLVIGVDWSVNGEKRWMTRAELQANGAYLVFPPEPVGCIDTLLPRLRSQIPARASALIGFDFPIGLPEAYAEVAGIRTFREALSQFGQGRWMLFGMKWGQIPPAFNPFTHLPRKREDNTQAGPRGRDRRGLLFQAVAAL